MQRILVVGAGFAGATYARELAESGYRVEVIDRRPHVGGNAYDETVGTGVRVHRYGPHLFHTNNAGVVEWLRKFGEFVPYQHRVTALLPDGRNLVPLPINRRTINTVFGVALRDEPEVRAFLARMAVPCEKPRNAAEHLASQIGTDLTDLFFRPYTKKMWALDLEEMDTSVVKRIPLRYDDEDRYFPGDKFQMMPRGGYAAVITCILDHPSISVTIGTAFDRVMLADFDFCFNSMPIDEYFDFVLGPLPYRSIRFHHWEETFDGGIGETPVVNYTDSACFTRQTDWSRIPCHVQLHTGRKTLTREEPCDYTENNLERYYPVKTSDGRYQAIYAQYKVLAEREARLRFIGRCGTYQYLDMDQVINQSLQGVRAWLAGRHRVGTGATLNRRRLLCAAAAMVPAMAAEAAQGEGNAAMPDEVVDVRQFGAKADGVTDDAPAFNAALRSLRERQHKLGGFTVGPKLLIPAGTYCIADSIDMTQLQSINMLIDGNGAVLLARCGGKPVIDALGSRWLAVRDLTVIGDKAAPPSVGIQIGRARNGVVADDHRFANVKLIGHYTLACLVNVAAETSGFDHLLLWNDYADPNSYCLIQDGLDHFATRSAFIPETPNRDQDDSFNENEFINCDFRHGGGGVPVWLGDTARHRFYRCYAAGGGRAAFVVYCGNNSHTMLDVDCHCETKALKSVFLLTGTRQFVPVQGFSYIDHRTFASRSVFTCEPPVQHVALRDARIEIGSFAVERCRVFDDPRKWQMTGHYSSADERAWNGAGGFRGTLLQGDAVGLVGPVALTVQAGPTEQRPAGLGSGDAGRLFLDLAKGRLVVWSGHAWLDSTGKPN